MILPERRPPRRRHRHRRFRGPVLQVSVNNGRGQARCTCGDFRRDQMCGHVWFGELMLRPLRRLMSTLPSIAVYFEGS